MRNRHETFYKMVVDKGMFPSVNSLKFYTKMIFKNFSFENKSILDIGGGSGILSYYAVLNGASRAVCVDPFVDRSSLSKGRMLPELNGVPELSNVEFMSVTFNSFDPRDELFDMILLHNSVNHLDEKACIELQKDSNARKKYSRMFSRMKEMLKPGGEILICDCSSRNIFPSIKLHNFFAPNIEWHKHQPPEKWMELLKAEGFIEPVTKWNSPKTLGAIGNFFLGNRVFAYFLTSHFCLNMKRKS